MFSPMSEKTNRPPRVSAIPYIGERLAADFARCSVVTIEDLLLYKPRTFIDLTKTTEIKNLPRMRGEKVAVKATIEKVNQTKTARKRIWLTEATLFDETGEIPARWFNQPFLKQSLKVAQELIFYGQVEFNFIKKQIFISNPEMHAAAAIIPVYPLTGKLSQKIISRAVKNALKMNYEVEEFIPAEVLKKNNLPEINQAIRMMHFPRSLEEFWLSKRRLIFGELFIFMLANLLQRQKNQQSPAYKIKNFDAMDDFIAKLPFKLTQDQKNVIDEIKTDLQKEVPASRLIEGDVGSGKTVVALAGTVAVASNGLKAVWLAPTEILSQQHYETARRFLADTKIKISLVTATTKKEMKKQAEKLEDADLIIGTHALLQKDIILEKVGLVVVDEQHRFGVEQRAKLASGNIAPHFLSLSATPIPRTLAHILFGNLDISIIRSKPAGRLPVKTYLISEQKRADAYKFIFNLIKAGQQAFVICPFIEQKNSDSLFDLDDRKAVETEFADLAKTILGTTRIEKLHGKMKASEKEAIMSRMKKGEIDVLVSTSVVEVGVDIPNATVMIIEDADKFGLAQLHQFRGRVGRNDLQSYCFIFSKNIRNEKTKKRLKAFVGSTDGFELSKIDLQLRGPGAVLGLVQSGYSEINPLWLEDTALLKSAQAAAEKYIGRLDKFSAMSKKVEKVLETDHLE